jgi:hypothetical protein
MVFMPTGAGKSIVVDFCSVMAAFTNIRGPNSCHLRRAILYGVPTIALANEAHIRLTNAWRQFADDYLAHATPEQKQVLPRICQVKTAGGFPMPLLPIKLIAGGSDKENLFVTGRSGDDAETQGGAGNTRQIASIIVCTFENVLSILQRAYEALGMGYDGTIGEHVGGVIKDECHYAQNLSRLFGRVLIALARALGKFTIDLTGTPSESLPAAVGLPARVFHCPGRTPGCSWNSSHSTTPSRSWPPSASTYSAYG